MPDEPAKPAEPLTLNQPRLDALLSAMQSSYRDWSADMARSLDKSQDHNKQLAAFYERLLLLSTGTIGVSVSGLLSFGSKAGSMGHAKYFVVVLVALAWFFLLLSIVLCRNVMMTCLIANDLLYKGWLQNSMDFNGSAIANNMQRISTAFSGTVGADGTLVDVKQRSMEAAQQVRDHFELSKKASITSTPEYKHEPAREEGKRAIMYMEIGLILLGIAAITLLCRL